MLQVKVAAGSNGEHRVKLTPDSSNLLAVFTKINASYIERYMGWTSDSTIGTSISAPPQSRGRRLRETSQTCCLSSDFYLIINPLRLNQNDSLQNRPSFLILSIRTFISLVPTYSSITFCNNKMPEKIAISREKNIVLISQSAPTRLT